MQKRVLEVRRLGRVAYADGLELQKTLETAVIADRKRDFLLLLEHPHTFTIGRRARENGVLASATTHSVKMMQLSRPAVIRNP